MIHFVFLFLCFIFTHTLAMDGNHSSISALIAKALDPDATDEQLETSFKELDAHPQSQLIRQKLVDENKNAWWSMAMNLSENVHKDINISMPVTLKEATNTAQFYRLHSFLRTLDITGSGAPLVSTVSNKIFCINDPKKIESLIIRGEGGDKIAAAKEDNSTGAIRIFKPNTIFTRNKEDGEITGKPIYITNIQKMVVSHDGKWIFATYYNQQPMLTQITEKAVGKNFSFPENTKCIACAFDDNDEYGIYATPKEVKTVKVNGFKLSGRCISDIADVQSVDITPYGTFGLIASKNTIMRIFPKLLFEKASTPCLTINTQHLTNARLSSCGSYAFSTHSNGQISIWNLENNTCIHRVFPDEILTKIALNHSGNSLVFGGQTSLARVTIVSILDKLRTTALSNIATLIRVDNKPGTLKDSIFLKNKFVQMSFPNRKKVLELAALTLEQVGLTDCPICYDEIADSTTPCKHIFCGTCLEQQKIKPESTCPFCRAPLAGITP